MKIKAALHWAAHCLSAYTPTPHLDAQVLLAHCLQWTRAQLLAYNEQHLSSAMAFKFKELIYRRQMNEPIAYLVGTKEFWSLPFSVTPASLIPRQETELLVELILNYYSSDAAMTLADLGTGSGAIALALAHECPYWHITATDRSAEALIVAERNAQQLGVHNVQFRYGDWCGVFSAQERFHVLISNPPYLALNDPYLRSGLCYEPQVALVAGRTGLEALEAIISQAGQHLWPGGRLWLEHGYNQAGIVSQLLHCYGFIEIEKFYDLAGILRVSMAMWSGMESDR